MRNDYRKLGVIIKTIRIDKELSQHNLANLVGVSHTEISRIERGERRTPNLVTLIAICEILDIDFQELLKEAGFLGFKDNKVFEILIEKKFTKVVKISSKSKSSALKSVKEFEEEHNIETLSPSSNINFQITKIENNDKQFREEMKKYIFSKNKKYKNYDLTDDIFVQNLWDI